MQEDSKKSLLPFVIATSVFSILVIGLWLSVLRNQPDFVAWLGAGYALLCFGFLIFQMVAFVKAHVDYDQSVELTKFDPIDGEESQWHKV